MLVRDIATLLSSTAKGDDSREVSEAAPLESAGPQDLSFVGNAKFFAAAQASKAGCLIALPEYEPVNGQAVIASKNPRAAFALILTHLYPKTKPPVGIHPTAVIDPTANIAADASVGPQVTIGANTTISAGTVIEPGCAISDHVTIGEDSWLHSRVTIYPRVQIGARAVLHSGCVLGADGFGFALTGDRYQKFPQVGTVVIGDDVEIGANSCVDRAALGVTKIGNGVKLDNMVHIGHNCDIGNHVVIAAQTGLSGGVVVEDYAVIGGQVGIGDKARIETKAVLGSGSGVLTSKIIRSGQTVWGTPARPLKQYLKQLAAMSKLPELHAEIAEIKKKLE